MKLELELPDDVAMRVNMLIARSCASDANTHGPLDLKTLARLLLEDVALAVHRPVSREGAKMTELLESHGYRIE
jgi:hypothetical protein